MKPRSDSKLTGLKGRQWNGEPAADYLYDRLMGEDGEQPWSVEVAAKEVTKRLRRPISASGIRRWLKAEHARRRAADNMEILQRSTLEFLSEHGSSLENLDRTITAQVVLMTARIHSEDGAEEAVKAMNAFTQLLKTLTDKEKLQQRIKEHDERVAKLKSELEALRNKLNKGGTTGDAGKHLDQVVALVDRVMGLSR